MLQIVLNIFLATNARMLICPEASGFSIGPEVSG